MPAARRDATLIQHQDQIRGMDGAQAVGDDKRRASVHDPFQRNLDQMLRLAVHAGCGIIEDQNPRVGQQGAGNCQALLLSAGKRPPAFAHFVS